LTRQLLRSLLVLLLIAGAGLDLHAQQPTLRWGGDVAPDRYEEPKGFPLSIQITSAADAERIFLELARDGRVVMPLEKTFWAERFGMVVDRFGIPWLINCEGSDQSSRE
jgi:uncharacterized glyoxalase superfamily protein PhnB